ncbi:copper-containing nitrite reductase [Fodinibius halophilus]|uniref:Copper-containing nitrite reductase n=1 Tax=Fodinibius halophilus TaxID=1736908 RepID=A0A6M1T3Z7_9BACT|nr:copper-containing nitrite reductase [Fodinibius halophilus]NGP88797.1 nitrite reductase, copper-containing [Fodinibius halophilus]
MNSLRDKLTTVLLTTLSVALLYSCSSKDNFNPQEAEIEGEEKAELTMPPNVPPPIDRDHATKLTVDLEVVEKEMKLADGVTYTMWTFGGSVPGKFIRVREGDMVEFHLKNHPDNKLPHNIDLHAVNGPGGGAESTFTAPGRETVFSFRALNPGLYVYHCATAPVGMHIANGMYGLILVEPHEGLPEVDKEYYVMQSEFYTEGDYGERGLQPFDMNKAIDEHPEYVVFNGAVNSMMNDKSITAEKDDKVRLFVGNGGPNLTSSFHVIGEIFDKVHYEGGDHVQKNVQTTSVPAGGASMVEFTTEVPGNFILVDHAIFRAFNKGALATLSVSGEEDENVYTGQQLDRVYQPEGGAIQEMPEEKEREIPTAQTVEERIKFGQETYMSVCQSCHMKDGSGVEGAFPPVAESDYLNDDPKKGISAVVHGLSGEITVNGETYKGIMPKQNLTDEEVANVITYILNNFGNDGGTVTPEQVAEVREQGPVK